MDDKLDKIVNILYQSLKNLRKATAQVDLTQKRIAIIAQEMKRTSYLAELEFNYVFALRCKSMQCGVGSGFNLLMLDYIDHFYALSDVLEDLKPYLLLLNGVEDVVSVRDRFRDRIQQIE